MLTYDFCSQANNNTFSICHDKSFMFMQTQMNVMPALHCIYSAFIVTKYSDLKKQMT